MKINHQDVLVEVEDILDLIRSQTHYFRKGFQVKNGSIKCQCPFHKNGEENTPSAYINKEYGSFYCFGCKTKTNLVGLIDYTIGDGVNWLKENFDLTIKRGFRVKEKREVKLFEKSYVTDYNQYKMYHEYFKQRKIHPKVADLFDLGYNNNEVLFPNKDENGNCVFVAKRNIKFKKYHYPKNVEKVLYGYYEIKSLMEKGIEIKEIYITEGMIDALTIWSYGKFAIALNGTGSKEQYQKINLLPFRKIILALDNDDAGEIGCNNLKKNCNKIFYCLKIPKKDVNELTKEEFLNCKEELMW